MGARSPVLEPYGDEFSWSLLDATPDGVLIAAATGEIVFVNDQALALFGYDAEALIGTPVEILIPEELAAIHQAHRTRYRTDPTTRPMGAGFRLRARRADGTRFPVEISLSPLRLGGEVFAVAAVRDVTDRVEAEEELRQSQEALRQAEQVLAVADDRDRIARDLHDTVIQRLFAAGLNLQSTMAGTDDRTRARLEVTVDDLDGTIKDLRMAIFSLHAAAASPGGLRGRVLEVITDTSDALGFEPRLQFDGPIETIDPDIAEHLIPVLREALVNVARHAGAQNARVIVSVSNEVVLQVSDDGVGVPDEVLGGRGLTNMSSRAQQLGGACTIGRAASGGSILTWRVPADLGGGRAQR